MKAWKLVLTPFLVFGIAGCCIPIMGPCAQSEYHYQNVLPANAATLSPNRKSAIDVGVSVTEIKRPGTAAWDKLTAPAITIMLPEGEYSFLAYAHGGRKAFPLGVFCKKKLVKGNYHLRALSQRNGPMISQVIIVQDANTGELVCRDTSIAAPLPDWTKPYL